MSVQGATDALSSVPSFPKERTVHGIVSLVATANTVYPSKTLYFANGSILQLAVGYVANGVNVGNTSGDYGFNEIGPTISTLTGGSPNDSVILSQNTAGTIYTGNIVEFQIPITYAANTLDVLYAANTYLVTDTRLANTNSNTAAVNATTHVGWNYLVQGTGGRAGRITVETLSVLANGQASNTNSGGAWFSGE